MYSSIGFLAALAATAAAKTVVVTAGSGGFVFSPDSVTADVGDTLEFHFVGSIHSAVQGDFSTPCQGSSTGFDSGAVTSSEVFQVTVQNTDPIWFFCATPTHCQGGMVGVVNPPASGDSLAAFKSAAADISSSSSAGKAQGGVVVAAGSSPSPSLSPSPSSSTPSPKSTPSSSSATVLTSGSSASASASGTASASSPATSPTTSASGSVASSPAGSATSSPSTSATPASTGAGNSLAGNSGKTALVGLVFGLGVFVAFLV